MNNLGVIVSVAASTLVGVIADARDIDCYSKELIHPNAEGACEWNVNAKWFMYAPSFGFTNCPGTATYHFRVEGEQGVTFRYESAKPVVSLQSCWAKLPVGYVTVSCEAGTRKFWKAAPFREGTYPKAVKSYRQAAKDVYEYVLGMKETRYLREHGRPDASYELNTYVSKMFSKLITSMIRYGELEPSRRSEALDVAKKAADHLIAKSEPAGAPLEYFPPTYDGRGEKDNGYIAEKFKGQIMLIYPAGVASAFVKLSQALGDKRYLEQAEKIAATYLRLQGEDGTWYLKMWAKDGKPVGPNRLIPVESAIPMFEALFAATGKPEYRAAADRAFKSVEGRLADWNWEGQFEDVHPTARYVNLTKHPACSTAIYLGRRYPGDPARLAQMREIVRFAEDQFVCWENPYRDRGVKTWDGTYDDWITPCALEQYNCYYPIDASAAKIIKTFVALYRADPDPVYLAKARALGDTATRMQGADGRIPTWWWPKRARLVYADWINCMMAIAEALEELAEAVRDCPRLLGEMAAFDAEKARFFERVGGEKYARMAELAWRQSFGGGKLVASPEGEMLYFSKENTSNGCTDDFTGHLAHNANLSIKSIAAFEAFSRLAAMRGLKESSARFHELAVTGAAKWSGRAADGRDGATVLAFGEKGTWSLKYNLAFARALGIDLFPDGIRRREIAAYLKNADRFGIPLDNRKKWCKVDWLFWCATLADNRGDFEAMIAPVYDFLNTTADRVAFPDLYYTETALCTRWGRTQFVGFNARPVIGGIYLPCLAGGLDSGAVMPIIWRGRTAIRPGAASIPNACCRGSAGLSECRPLSTTISPPNSRARPPKRNTSVSCPRTADLRRLYVVFC